jgi:hypothetical protein
MLGLAWFIGSFECVIIVSHYVYIIRTWLRTAEILNVFKKNKTVEYSCFFKHNNDSICIIFLNELLLILRIILQLFLNSFFFIFLFEEIRWSRTILPFYFFSYFDYNYKYDYATEKFGCPVNCYHGTNILPCQRVYWQAKENKTARKNQSFEIMFSERTN